MSRSLVALMALASAAALPAAAQRSRVVVVVPGKVTSVLTDTSGTPYHIPQVYTFQEAFRALVAVYGELKIPSEFKDSTQGQVGSEMFYKQGSLGGRQLSSYLSCGDSMTGPNADTY